MKNGTLAKNGTVVYIYWSAIFAGAIITLVLFFLLDLLGLGLGFTVFTADTQTLANLGKGSALWLFLTSIVSAMMGGWVAGKFSGIEESAGGMLHGVLAWSFATLLSTTLMLSLTGAIVSGLIGTVGKGVGAAGQGISAVGKSAIQSVPQIAEAAQSMVPALAQTAEQLKEQVKKVVTEVSNDNIQKLSEENKAQLIGQVADWVSAEKQETKQSAKEKVRDFISQNMNMNQQEAEEMLQKWDGKYVQLKSEVEQRLQQAKKDAVAIIEPASHISGGVIIFIFLGFLLSGIGAAITGMYGSNQNRM